MGVKEAAEKAVSSINLSLKVIIQDHLENVVTIGGRPFSYFEAEVIEDFEGYEPEMGTLIAIPLSDNQELPHSVLIVLNDEAFVLDDGSADQLRGELHDAQEYGQEPSGANFRRSYGRLEAILQLEAEFTSLATWILTLRNQGK